MKYFFSIISSLFFVGCSSQNIENTLSTKDISKNINANTSEENSSTQTFSSGDKKQVIVIEQEIEQALDTRVEPKPIQNIKEPEHMSGASSSPHMNMMKQNM